MPGPGIARTPPAIARPPPRRTLGYVTTLSAQPEAPSAPRAAADGSGRFPLNLPAHWRLAALAVAQHPRRVHDLQAQPLRRRTSSAQTGLTMTMMNVPKLLFLSKRICKIGCEHCGRRLHFVYFLSFLELPVLQFLQR